MSVTWIKRAVFERTTAEDLGNSAQPILDAWIYLNLCANIIVLTLLVATFLLAKTVHRHPFLINMCVTIILSGIFSNMLWFTGQHVGPEPSISLCITQTSFLYGTTPMLSLAVFALVYYVAVSYHSDHTKRRPGRVKVILMLVAPYIALATFTIATAIVSIKYPQEVNRRRRFFYCSLHFDKLTTVMSLFTSAVLLVVTVLEIQLAYNMYRNWRGIRKAGHSGGVQLQLVLRVLVFGFYCFTGMIISAVSIVEHKSPVPDLFCATTGLSTFLVFGTQPDVLNAWAFWRNRSSKSVGIAKLAIYHPRDPTWGLEEEKIEGSKDIVITKHQEVYTQADNI
jgi:hypothetical protein